VSAEAPVLPIELSIHGATVTVESDDTGLSKRVADDFPAFAAEPPARGREHLTIRASRTRPDYDALPPLLATVYTPRNVCYSDGRLTYLDYFGKALALWDRELRSFDVACEDLDLLHEIVYLTILSRVSETLEREGLHRVHAFGLEAGGEAALFLMPSGGGKTTLTLGFLKLGPPYRLVSEDSPLVDRKGRVHPFPLRIGVLGTETPPFPPEHVTFIRRMEFEPKHLVALAAFGDCLARGASTPRFLFVGRRRLGKGCAIRPAGKRTGWKALLEGMVVGVGLYQGVEFLLRTSLLDLFRLSGIGLSRARAALALLRRCEVHVVELGRDGAVNVEAVRAFLASRGFGAGRDGAGPEG
jgi:hypothetical protein